MLSKKKVGSPMLKKIIQEIYVTKNDYANVLKVLTYFIASSGVFCNLKYKKCDVNFAYLRIWEE